MKDKDFKRLAHLKKLAADKLAAHEAAGHPLDDPNCDAYLCLRTGDWRRLADNARELAESEADEAARLDGIRKGAAGAGAAKEVHVRAADVAWLCDRFAAKPAEETKPLDEAGTQPNEQAAAADST